MVTQMKDGGKRVSYGKNAAQREPHRGKGRYDYISPFALRRMAFWLEAGGMKYGSRNWEKGMPYEHPMDSLLRHANDYRRGDRSEDHLAAIATNAFFLMHYQDCGMDDIFDTLPTYPEANTPEQDAINKARLTKIPEEEPKTETEGAQASAALRKFLDLETPIDVAALAHGLCKVLRSGTPKLDRDALEAFARLFEVVEPMRSPSKEFVSTGIGAQCAAGIRAGMSAATSPHVAAAIEKVARDVKAAVAANAARTARLRAIQPDPIDHKNIMPEPIAQMHTDEQITMRSTHKVPPSEHPTVIGHWDGEEQVAVPRSTYYRMKDGLAHSEGVSALHDCNDCPALRDCAYVPRPGEWVRINCPLHPNVNARRAPRAAKPPLPDSPSPMNDPEGAWSRC